TAPRGSRVHRGPREIRREDRGPARRLDPGGDARPRPRRAELVRERHVRHLPHGACRRRARPSRPRAGRGGACARDHDLRVARPLARAGDRSMSTGAGRKLRLGVAGLGRAFMLMLPTLVRHPRVALAGAADPRAEARERVAREFGAPAHASVEALCADPSIDAIYVATPNEHHAAHAIAAASAGKHVLVEKPMAISLAEADAMIAAARSAAVHLVVGPSHSFDA